MQLKCVTPAWYGTHSNELWLDGRITFYFSANTRVYNVFFFFLNPLAVANSKSFENVSLTQKKKRIVFDKPKKQTNKQNKRSQRPLAWCSWDLWSLALTKNISNVIVTLTWYGTQICNVNKFNTKWQYFVKVNITKAAWRCATNILKISQILSTAWLVTTSICFAANECVLSHFIVMIILWVERIRRNKSKHKHATW